MLQNTKMIYSPEYTRIYNILPKILQEFWAIFLNTQRFAVDFSKGIVIIKVICPVRHEPEIPNIRKEKIT